MQKLMTFMQQRFAPKVNKITKNVWIASIQDAVMGVLPFILVGSLITLLSLINEIKLILPDLTLINSFSFGLLGLFVAFLIPYNVLDKNKIHDKKVIAGLASIALYLMVIMPVINENGQFVVAFDRFGAGGMFVSIIVGLFVGIIMLLFSKFSFFSKESSLPDFIIVWFDTLIPIALLLAVGWIFMKFNIDFFDIIVTLLDPLQNIGQSFIGFVLICFLMAFLYSFGISTWVLNPIIFPIMVKGIADNAALASQGLDPVNINTQEVVYTGWVAFGGIGYTLPLGILLLFAASSRLKAIGRATIVPSIFNINEPIVFGAPIVFNPMLMIPFWINGLVMPIITYLVLHLGWVSIPAKAFQLWYLPYPISTYLVNGDWRGIILFLAMAALSFLIWYPFFKVYDNQELKQEKEASL
ncbi:PTS system transporter subunit IIC [Listeria floridensis FSL S10-1187]|uniref:Permease IIC component n=1 Tax=Listeria floridensis FSL S10-1187 TaxID=1265817 RepID=A0ABP3B2D8_9LIST|nr:PTS transporter subunit EIIC [Listeria floridensis]EUJ33733.1 PTS system transporter subunit IIC [Listeria floridensis FSL S10-1187]